MASRWTAPEERPGAGDHDHLGQLGGAAADVGPGLLQGGDKAGAGRLESRHWHLVDIGEQVVFLVTGQFREFTDASHPEVEHPQDG